MYSPEHASLLMCMRHEQVKSWTTLEMQLGTAIREGGRQGVMMLADLTADRKTVYEGQGARRRNTPFTEPGVLSKEGRAGVDC